MTGPHSSYVPRLGAAKSTGWPGWGVEKEGVYLIEYPCGYVVREAQAKLYPSCSVVSKRASEVPELEESMRCLFAGSSTIGFDDAEDIEDRGLTLGDGWDDVGCNAGLKLKFLLKRSLHLLFLRTFSTHAVALVAALTFGAVSVWPKATVPSL